MQTTYHFIEPIDTLFLRGNKLFGDPGSYGESLVPPWPSVAAGALRSALLAERGYDPARFLRGEIDDIELGTPARPGSFAITGFQVARRRNGTVEPLFPLPADLSVMRGVPAGEREGEQVHRIRPRMLTGGVQTSAATGSLAVLPVVSRGKPDMGYWLTAAGWAAYVRGGPIDATRHLTRTETLWSIDTRIGIALDASTGRASDGNLFTSQGIVFRKREHDRGGGRPSMARGCDAGFLVAVSGAALPDEMTLRFGGDGRAALATRVEARPPEVDYDRIATEQRCRLILTAPGLFAGGWKPTGVTGAGRDLRFDLHGVRGRLTCAAVPRSEVVSGFDIAVGRPKPAQRAAPTGSVYWLDELNATGQALSELVACGLWPDPVEHATRQTEGFNRCAVARY